ncbi:helix-turn-helix domain-containing protein [Deinococcus sp. KNUC1210]|uniref:helix-turn-helix domain-containing protein n=1 Tax=Deinococcus sp. KNUC1210 TaxID=2917691 RepID=UPI001EF064E0|nr:helix-turn-helix transcriptional regulator [Deinococcus sp. KNUC1210]ULH14765.1 helix-turn-helix domain-containing protein [Deinococcus sp. KNUC1210]
MTGRSSTAHGRAGQALDKHGAGQLIRQRREALGYTQEDVVAHTSIPVSTYVSELENGKVSVGRSKHFPSLAQFLQLSEADVRAINPAAVIEVRAGPQAAEQLERDLSPNLARAAELYADRPRYAGFGTPRWLNYLNAFNFYDGQEPEPEGWAELFLTLKQSNVTPGDRE